MREEDSDESSPSSGESQQDTEERTKREIRKMKIKDIGVTVEEAPFEFKSLFELDTMNEKGL
jgi:hypothetical protein